MLENNSFLGRGWSFPPSFDNTIGEVVMQQGEADIQESLKILLSTSLGERIMQPRYGCNLTDLLFETLDTTLWIVMTLWLLSLFVEIGLNYRRKARLEL